MVRCYDSDNPEIINLRLNPDLISVSKRPPLDRSAHYLQLSKEFIHTHLWHMFDFNSPEADRLWWFDDGAAEWFCHSVPACAAFLAMRAITHRIARVHRSMWM